VIVLALGSRSIGRERRSSKGARRARGGAGKAGLLGAPAFPHAFIHPTSWKLLFPDPKREKMSREELPNQIRKQSPTSGIVVPLE
jgi:hypothetical protein